MHLGAYAQCGTRCELAQADALGSTERQIPEGLPRRTHQRESRNVSSSLRSRAVRARKLLITNEASPRWRRIAPSRVAERRSCISRLLVRSPQSGAVRSLLEVFWGPFWTIPSPVPTSCSRKSL